MGDRRKRALGVQFDGKIKLRFHGAKITSDAGEITGWRAASYTLLLSSYWPNRNG